jgi:hypothetical protein
MPDIALTWQHTEAVARGDGPAGRLDMADVLACLRASRNAEPPPMSAELLEQLAAVN